MRLWQKRSIGLGIIFAFLIIITLLILHNIVPTGAAKKNDIVSYCIGETGPDKKPKLLAISGAGKLESGERYGQLLLVCDAAAESDLEFFGYIRPQKILQRIDLSGIKPMKVQLGDVNGDGVNEVAVCVYKTAEFHPVMAKRPFFFDLVDGNLIPVWLGSRLSRPFDDYILRDIDSDGIDEIISIEQLEDGKRAIGIYNWDSFGFEMLTDWVELDGEIKFVSKDTQKSPQEVSVEQSGPNGHKTLRFRLVKDRIVLER